MVRITDVHLAEWCNQMGLELEQITPHQLRIEGRIDFYPKRNRYFVIEEKRWGTAQSVEDLEAELAKSIAGVGKNDKTPVETFKSWYFHLASLPYSANTQAQLEMISAVLKLLLSEKEYEKISTLTDAEYEARSTNQEKLV